MRLLCVAVIPLVVAACAGNPTANRQAEQQCRAQGVTPGGAAFESCIRDVTENIYKSWGRDRINRGE